MTLDLRTGMPVWNLNGTPAPPHTRLTKDIHTEVAVIGGGISGALIAHKFASDGWRVAIVDSRDVGKGSTSASTALLSYEADVNLVELSKLRGKRNAVRAYQAGIEAIDSIEGIVHTVNDSCDFRKRRSLYLASSSRDVRKLRREFSARKRNGFAVEFLNGKDIERLFGLDAPGAILNQDAGEVNPLKLTLALVRDGRKKGLRVFSHTKVVSYERLRNESLLVTENRCRVKARHVVFATGYETQQFLKQKTVRLVSTYAIASTTELAFQAGYEHPIIWESSRPYLYVRTTTDNRLVAGGEDVDFQDDHKRDRLLPAKTKILERKLRRMFPHVPWKLAAAWTGTFAESDDGLPYIGVHPRFPGALFALGYGGNGITFAAIARRIISDLVAGKRSSDAKIFRFGRI
jgi:glycine/D-amino acid oxidase-like deaminating enzyme